MRTALHLKSEAGCEMVMEGFRAAFGAWGNLVTTKKPAIPGNSCKEEQRTAKSGSEGTWCIVLAVPMHLLCGPRQVFTWPRPQRLNQWNECVELNYNSYLCSVCSFSTFQMKDSIPAACLLGDNRCSMLDDSHTETPGPNPCSLCLGTPQDKLFTDVIKL